MTMMNRAQTALAGVTLVVGGIVYGVHWDQERNKKEMRAGVLRDMERIKLKREQEKIAAAAAAAAASNEK
jgi:hypothetical protein